MLPAAHRLRRSGDFRRAVRLGRRRASPTVVVHHLGSGGDTALVGIAVGRSVGPAVVRNRVKRRLRHLMRGHLDELAPGLTVVRATSRAATDPTPALATDLTGCLRRLEVLRP